MASACSSTRPPPTCLLVGFGNRTLRTSFNESRRAWAWQWAAAAGRLNTNFTYFLPRRIRSEFCEFYAQGPNSARISGHRIFSTAEFGPYLTALGRREGETEGSSLKSGQFPFI